MEDSILISIKKLLGIDEHYDCFDLDIITHINTVFLILYQMGVKDEQVFSIHDETSLWSDYLGDESKLALIKTYMFRRVQKMFDPPTSPQVSEAADKVINELEWRIQFFGDKSLWTDEVV